MAAGNRSANTSSVSDYITGALTGHLAFDGQEYALPGATADSSGTPGAATQHTTKGRVAVAAGQSQVTVTNRLGGRGQPLVFNADGRWQGVCHISGLSGAPAHGAVLVGLAGNVGELIHGGVQDIPSIEYAIARHLRTGDVSKSDRELMGDDWVAHITDVVELLLGNWPSVLTAAERLATRAGSAAGPAGWETMDGFQRWSDADEAIDAGRRMTLREGRFTL